MLMQVQMEESSVERWDAMYGPGRQPTPKQVAAFSGGKLWMDLNDWLRDAYAVVPRYSYSRNSRQGGWYIKYAKAGQPLCTLYPMEGYFVVQVVIGAKEARQVEDLLAGMCAHTRDVYHRTPLWATGRWLMLEVRDDAVLRDVQALIEARRQPRQH